MLKNVLTLGIVCLFLLISTTSSAIAQEKEIPEGSKSIPLTELFHLYDTGLMCTALTIVNLEFSEIVSPGDIAYIDALTLMSDNFSGLAGDLFNIIKQDNAKLENPINIEEFTLLKKDTLDNAIDFWRQQYNNTIESARNRDTADLKSFQALIVRSVSKCMGWFNSIGIVKN